MKEFILSGKLVATYDDGFTMYKLETKDGLKQDLIYRFRELFSSFEDEEIQISYIACNRDFTYDEAIEGWLLHLDGALEGYEEFKKINAKEGETKVDYQAVSYQYSSYTHGHYYNTDLLIGGHDLKNEFNNLLNSGEDKYLHICFNVGKYSE